MMAVHNQPSMVEQQVYSRQFSVQSPEAVDSDLSPLDLLRS